jgi:hypothetical protein
MSGTGVPHHRLCSVEDRTLGMTKALFLSGSPQVLSPATKCDDLQCMPSIRTHLSRVRPLDERRNVAGYPQRAGGLLRLDNTNMAKNTGPDRHQMMMDYLAVMRSELAATFWSVRSPDWYLRQMSPATESNGVDAVTMSAAHRRRNLCVGVFGLV